eukprot:351621-Chlamydomonas_euryale.AAC.3
MAPATQALLSLAPPPLASADSRHPPTHPHSRLAKPKPFLRRRLPSPFPPPPPQAEKSLRPLPPPLLLCTNWHQRWNASPTALHCLHALHAHVLHCLHALHAHALHCLHALHAHALHCLHALHAHALHVTARLCLHAHAHALHVTARLCLHTHAHALSQARAFPPRPSLCLKARPFSRPSITPAPS